MSEQKIKEIEQTEQPEKEDIKDIDDKAKDLAALFKEMEEFQRKDEEENGETILLSSKELEEEVTVKSVEKRGTFYKKSGMLSSATPGSFVAVRLASEDKTYLGIFLGDFAIDVIPVYRDKSKKIQITPRTNPAMFVPELQKVVFGCESWWSEIKSVEKFKEIADEDIENQWYVKALQQIHPIERAERKEQEEKEKKEPLK